MSVFFLAEHHSLRSPALLVWIFEPLKHALLSAGLWIDSLENQNVSLCVRAHQAPSVDKILNAQQKTVDDMNVNRAFYWMPEEKKKRRNTSSWSAIGQSVASSEGLWLWGFVVTEIVLIGCSAKWISAREEKEKKERLPVCVVSIISTTTWLYVEKMSDIKVLYSLEWCCFLVCVCLDVATCTADFHPLLNNQEHVYPAELSIVYQIVWEPQW